MKSQVIKIRNVIACGVFLSAAAFGDRVDTFRARMVGGGDHGKCTIEVVVDGAVEIELRGDEGRMRTISGAPGQWRRMECNQPLPPNPGEFRFSGVDGRGSQTLLREPRDNRGAALIRIDDPKGGREGYTFDIEWRGTAVGFNDRDRDRLRWDDEINFRGRGDGYFRNFRGRDDVLGDCQVTIDRHGEVHVTFNTNRRSLLTLTGRLTLSDRDRLVADMSGDGSAGSMEIRLNGRDRITDINMSSAGRDRFDLRWHKDYR